MQRIIKEPLFHFLLLGGLLFLSYGWINKNEPTIDDSEIILDDSDINRLAQAYQQNWNQAPDSVALHKLIEEEIKFEIFYREALRLNLDHNDIIVKRRLGQKYEFLLKDMINTKPENDDMLKEYYSANKDKYKRSKSVSFYQIFFNKDQENRVLEFLKINSQKHPDVISVENHGDPSHLSFFYKEMDVESIKSRFGSSFARSIIAQSDTGWTDILTSEFGQHAVYIQDIHTSEVIPFEKARSKVLSDWQTDQVNLENQILYKDLLKDYTVKLELNDWKDLIH